MGSPVFVGFQRILVAFDASPHAEHALNVALSMAGDMKAKLFVLAVIRPPELAESAEFNAVLDEGRERYESSFVPIRERAKQKGIDLETDVVVVAIGNRPNLMVASSTSGLSIGKRGTLEAEPGSGQTSKPHVYAGGDVVTGEATP